MKFPVASPTEVLRKGFVQLYKGPRDKLVHPTSSTPRLRL